MEIQPQHPSIYRKWKDIIDAKQPMKHPDENPNWAKG